MVRMLVVFAARTIFGCEGLAAHGEDPLRDGDRAGDREGPEGDVHQDREVEDRAQARHHEDGDEAVGALGDADVGGEGGAIDAGTCVGRDGAHHDADHRQPQVEAAVARSGEVQRQAAEDRAVADPVQRGVEERAEGRAAAGLAGHGAVEEVAEDEAGDEDGAAQQVAAREERERAHAHADRPDEGHGVRADAEPDEEVDDRCENDALPERLESVQHGGVRLAARVRQDSNAAQTASTALGTPVTDHSLPAAVVRRWAPPTPSTSAAPGSRSQGGTECRHATWSWPCAIALRSMEPEPSIRSVATPATTRPNAWPTSSP